MAGGVFSKWHKALICIESWFEGAIDRVGGCNILSRCGDLDQAIAEDGLYYKTLRCLRQRTEVCTGYLCVCKVRWESSVSRVRAFGSD